MNEWAGVFLGIIAFATLLSALLQAAVLVAAMLVARRVHALVDRVEPRIVPVFNRIDAIGTQVSHAATSAAAQLGRVATLLDDVTRQADRATRSVRQVAREGDALAAGARAMVDGLARGARRSRG